MGRETKSIPDLVDLVLFLELLGLEKTKSRLKYNQHL